MAEESSIARRTVRPRRRGDDAPRIDPEQRDENGLTPWHYSGGRQIICGTCNCGPCADRCTEQWMPDTLQLRAKRAGLTVEQWAAVHADWVGWELHIDRPDVRNFLIEQAMVASAQTSDQQDQQWPARERRALPLDVAMAQAMAIVAGETRPEEVTPAQAGVAVSVAAEGRHDA